MKINWKKVLTVGVPMATAGLSLVASWLEDKKLEDTVTEKVSEALSNVASKES